jgi:ATP-dependent RNA helicase RhlE
VEATFDSLDLNRALLNAIADLGYTRPTPIQEQSFPIIRSGANVVGISQTGTGKTMAFLLPMLRDLPFSKQITPRVLILVPTRELVTQLVEEVEKVTKYMSVRAVGVYGGTNINTQAQQVAQGVDILVATPGRLYDLTLNANLRLKAIQKVVIDEVDVMLDLGFRVQLENLFDLLPERRQNIMYSATMTEEVEHLIKAYFVAPQYISIAISGTPLERINQTGYAVPNFYSKVNLLAHLLEDREVFRKVLVFSSSKKRADLLMEKLEGRFSSRMDIIHSNKSQNARLRAVADFDEGKCNILIATDIIARGLDFDRVSHVINFDSPAFPENYIHRIGRTGRAEEEGQSILFFTEKEEPFKESIEELMGKRIEVLSLPEEVAINPQLLPDEREDHSNEKHFERNSKRVERGPSFHEKKEKNAKENQGGSYRRELAKKYKKSQTRGDKTQNLRSKKKKRG